MSLVYSRRIILHHVARTPRVQLHSARTPTADQHWSTVDIHHGWATDIRRMCQILISLTPHLFDPVLESYQFGIDSTCKGIQDVKLPLHCSPVLATWWQSISLLPLQEKVPPVKLHSLGMYSIVTRKKCEALGVDDFFVHPFVPLLLRFSISRCLVAWLSTKIPFSGKYCVTPIKRSIPTLHVPREPAGWKITLTDTTTVFLVTALSLEEIRSWGPLAWVLPPDVVGKYDLTAACTGMILLASCNRCAVLTV